MKLETWIYKQALELYPRTYRDQFGQAMLETYADSLKAAKLEGGVFEFHKATTIDTIKGIFQATIELQNPNLLARAAAVFALIYTIFYLLGWSQFQILETTTTQIFRTSCELCVYVLGFILAARREFSEWLYFAIISIGTALRTPIWFYLATFNSSSPKLPDSFNVTFQIYQGIGWIIFFGFFVVVYFHSKEKHRLSRLLWYGIFSSLLVLAIYFIPAPQSNQEGFHIYTILVPINNLSGVVIYLFLALKFWQRSQSDFRLVQTRS